LIILKTHMTPIFHQLPRHPNSGKFNIPATRKRVLSEVENAAASGGAKGGAKKQRHETDVEVLTQENAELKSRLAEAYAFILKKNLVHGILSSPHILDLGLLILTDAPKGILADMLAQPDGVGLDAYADSLCNKMADIYGPMAEDTDNFRKTGVTSDDLSSEVVPFLRAVKTIRDAKDQPRSLAVAYKLITNLQSYSYSAPEASYGSRPSDALSDTMLLEVAKERRQKGEVWDYVGDLEDIERTSTMLKEYGIETYFPKAIALFKQWMGKDKSK
jgi:hypothetical protein